MAAASASRVSRSVSPSVAGASAALEGLIRRARRWIEENDPRSAFYFDPLDGASPSKLSSTAEMDAKEEDARKEDAKEEDAKEEDAKKRTAVDDSVVLLLHLERVFCRRLEAAVDPKQKGIKEKKGATTDDADSRSMERQRHWATQYAHRCL